MGDPAGDARDREQRGLAAGRQFEEATGDGERVVDIGKGTRSLGDALGYLDRETAVSSVPDQQIKERLCPRIALDVDHVSEAGEALAERDALAHDRRDVAFHEDVEQLGGLRADTAMA